MRNGLTRSCLFLCGLSFAAFVASCAERDRAVEPEPGGSSGGPHDAPGAVTDTVLAATGAVLETPGGIRVTIEPGDLPEDTAVSVVPVSYDDGLGQTVAAVRFEPEGLILDHPIVVSLPLPSRWPEDEQPIVWDFLGDDPSDAYRVYNYARLTGAPGDYRAEVLVSHFSGLVCASNCHAGTIRFLLAQFEKVGCSEADALAKVREKYPDVAIPDNVCGGRGVETVQAFLDTFFDDVGAFDTGVPVPPEVLLNLIEIAESGRQVVLAYRPGAWGARSGPNNFLATGAMEYAHTTAFEKRNGQWQLRNTLATSSSKLVTALGGNTVWYPVTQLAEFRNLPQGVAAELQYCGSPDCLAFPDRNPGRLDVYAPVAGVSFGDAPWSNAWDFLLTFGQWRGIPPRGIPWTATRIYVQKAGTTLNPCDEEETLAAAVQIPGYSGPFVVGDLKTDYATWNGDPGHPAIVAVTDPQAPPLETDRFSISFRRTISGPGVYNVTPTISTTDALASFLTMQILHEDFPTPVTFVQQSGTVTLEEFGTAKGSRLKGSFSVALLGEKITVQGSKTVLVPIEGTVSGSFDLVLEDDFP